MSAAMHDAPDRPLADTEQRRYLGLRVTLAQLAHLGVALQRDLVRWRGWGRRRGGQPLPPAVIPEEVGATGGAQGGAHGLVRDAEIAGEVTCSLMLGARDERRPVGFGDGGAGDGITAG